MMDVMLYKNWQLIETIQIPGLFINLKPLEIQHPLSFIGLIRVILPIVILYIFLNTN